MAESQDGRWWLPVGLVWIAAVAAAGTRLADSHDWVDVPHVVARIGAAAATWLAIVMATRRCGGRPILVAVFSAVVLGLVAGFPENWALAGAAVAGASAYGLLGLALTRPAVGFRAVGELLVSAVLGLAGAVVVTGYDVELRSYRFRVVVLVFVLAGGFVLAWRLGRGRRGVSGRGVALVAGGVGLLVASIAYTEAIREWGSPGVIDGVEDAKSALVDLLGALPRPLEALVGFPALVWGVAIRSRRRHGWWMVAFGGLGAAGVTSSLVSPDVSLADALQATAYSVVIGGVLGLLVVAVQRGFAGSGRRAKVEAGAGREGPETSRFAPLL